MLPLTLILWVHNQDCLTSFNIQKSDNIQLTFGFGIVITTCKKKQCSLKYGSCSFFFQKLIFKWIGIIVKNKSAASGAPNLWFRILGNYNDISISNDNSLKDEYTWECNVLNKLTLNVMNNNTNNNNNSEIDSKAINVKIIKKTDNNSIIL